MGPRNHVLDGGQDRTIRSCDGMTKRAMRPFCQIYVGHSCPSESGISSSCLVQRFWQTADEWCALIAAFPHAGPAALLLVSMDPDKQRTWLSS